MSDWQPIESAPKDGTVILICRAQDYPHTTASAVWEPVHQSWACSWDNWPIEDFAPTHWQPALESPRP